MHPSWNPTSSNIRILEYPSDVIKYMKQNAAPKQLLNLMQCSKRFCHKVFPYLPVRDLTIADDEEDKWWMQKLDNSLMIGTNFDEIPNGLWFTEYINLCDIPNLLSQILPKVAVIELEELIFNDQEISRDDLVKLLSHGSVKYVRFRYSPVRYGNGDVVPLDKMLEILTNIPVISYIDVPPFSVEAAEDLSKVDVSPKLVEFHLEAYKEEFDFGLYKKFIERNPQIFFDTDFFGDDLEDDFIEELEHLNEVALQNGLTDNAPIFFVYRGMPKETRVALYNLYREYRKLHNTE